MLHNFAVPVFLSQAKEQHLQDTVETIAQHKREQRKQSAAERSAPAAAMYVCR